LVIYTFAFILDNFMIHFYVLNLYFIYFEDGRKVGQNTYEFNMNIKPVVLCLCALFGTVTVYSLTSEEVSLREMSTYAGNFGKI